RIGPRSNEAGRICAGLRRRGVAPDPRAVRPADDDVCVSEMLSLTIEKPAAGGRMIARLDGQVVLVSGAIPGERVTARIERAGKGVLYAETVGVEDASPDRRPVAGDPECGGCLYAHVAYDRQLALES